jgi:adenosine deaminase
MGRLDSVFRSLSLSIAAFIEAMPKAELHIHLEGAIAPATLLRLAKRHGQRLPAEDVEGLQAWYRFTTFRHFIEVYLAGQACLRTAEDFALIVYELGADRARQAILYSEVTVTPYTHLWQQKGIRPEEIIEGLEDGRARARRDFGVEMRWVFDIPRNLPEPAGAWTAAYAIEHMEHGVVGFGLGGDESKSPPELWIEPFQRAIAAGLYSVPHAGEVAGPPSVWGALRHLGARRLGHGVRSSEDPALVAHLVETQIPLEVNPTSNLCLNVYPDFSQHPLRQLWDAGAYLTLNSDDPPMFNTTLTAEYGVLVEHFAFTLTELERISLNAVAAAAPLGMTSLARQQMATEFRAQFVQLRHALALARSETSHA